MTRRGFVPVVLLLLVLSFPAGAARLDPAQWQLTVDSGEAPPGAEVLARLTVKLEPGWHVYSPTTPPGGPVPTSIEVTGGQAISGYEVWEQAPVKKFDPAFQLDTETYAGGTTFLIRLRLAGDAAAGKVEVTAKVRYQLCDDRQCLPPRRKTLSAGFRIDSAAPPPVVKLPEDYQLAAREETAAQAASGQETRRPPAPEPNAGGETGLLRFLLIAFGFGIAGIFTPCVFPMIPIVMSQFLEQATGRRKDSLLQASVFCAGIIVLFSLLGLVTTAVLGPFGVVRLGSSVWVNGFIALVFLAFGLSLLGAFELRLPSGLLTRLNTASGRGGYAGTLLMGLTFSLAAFACVGPFVGTLLAASIQDGGLRPLLGMVAFAAGLAGPFFLLALFPVYLRRLPRAGGWMIRVKVVLGFVILAAMLKYASNVDQVLGWGLLDRSRFLAIWIVLFAMAGFYLLGLIRMAGVEPEQKLGVSRLLTGMALLVFAVSLIPGMFGYRLGELDAYLPEAEQSTLSGSPAAAGRLTWMKNQYDEALKKARAEGKLVLVAFTGYTCTNCHWMKANLFTRPEVAGLMKEYVLVELYTDGSDEASRRNQVLQEKRFSTVAIPFYAIFTPDEKVVAAFAGLTRDPAEFLVFLRRPVAGNSGTGR